MSVSPRSSALSRASALKRSSHDMSDFTNRLEANIMPVLQVAALVVCVVIAWIVGERYEATTVRLAWPEVTRNGTLAGAVLLAVLACTAWVTAHAYMVADHTMRLVLLGLFALVAVLLAVAAWMFFREDRVTAAFYLVVAAILAVAVHTYLCWRHLAMFGLAAMVPMILLVLFLLWQFWPESVPCTPATTSA